MVITVIGLHGAHVLLRVVLAQDTVHAVVPTLLHRLLVNLVITWEVMKTLRHASKVTVQVRSINFNLSLSFFHPSSFQFLILFLQFSHLVFKLPSPFQFLFYLSLPKHFAKYMLYLLFPVNHFLLRSLPHSTNFEKGKLVFRYRRSRLPIQQLLQRFFHYYFHCTLLFLIHCYSLFTRYLICLHLQLMEDGTTGESGLHARLAVVRVRSQDLGNVTVPSHNMAGKTVQDVKLKLSRVTTTIAQV